MSAPAGSTAAPGTPHPGAGRWGGLAHQLVLSATAALTTWAATLSWRGFTQDSSGWATTLLVLALVVALTGALGRWARVPGLVLVAGQVVVTALVALVALAGSAVPGPATGARLAEAFRGAVDSAQAYAAPVPADVPSVGPLLVVGGLACLLAVDVLAGTMRRAALAGLPLLTAYALPVSMLGSGAPWPVFVLMAVGFLALLALQEDDQVERWGRSLTGRGPSVLGRPAAARAGAGAVGGVATAFALVLPVAVPTAGVTLFEGGLGTGGDGEIQLDDPMVDLRRDLREREDVDLLRVRTDDPSPDYLRITVLERFSEDAWSSGSRDLPDSQRADGQELLASGVDVSVVATSPRYDYRMEATDAFRSTWLPHPFPVASVDAPGNWKFDLATLDFLAADEDGDLDTAGLTWSASGYEPAFDELALDLAADPRTFVDDVYLELPPDLPEVVGALAEQVTAESTSQLERAKALQAFFRETGDFQYSLEADPGNGGDALEEFLTEDEGGRIGYCEQFASAMAVMARHLGIPSRVAMGFLAPAEVGRGDYVYSTDDLHAWPELYFVGQGWVRFEPTPAQTQAGGRTGSPPPWSVGGAPVPAPAPEQGGLGSEPLPDRGGPADPAPAPEDEASTAADDTATEEGRSGWATAAGAGVALALLAALLLVPRTLRRWRADRRWAAVAAGAAPAGTTAWAELRAGCADLGVAWPGGLSPQATRVALTPAMLAGPVSAVPALERLVRLVEQEWYAPAGAGDGGADAAAVRADVELVLEAIADGVTPRARTRADWFPLPGLRRGDTGGRGAAGRGARGTALGQLGVDRVG